VSRMPVLSARKIVKAFGKAGFQFQRQTASHIILYSESRHQTLSIPDHDPVSRGTLRSLIRLSGMTPEEFLRLLD